MARPETFVRKERVKLEDKPLCTPKRGRAHRWVLGDPTPQGTQARCAYCRKKRVYASMLSDYERYSTVVLRDPRPQPSYGIYTPASSYE